MLSGLIATALAGEAHQAASRAKRAAFLLGLAAICIAISAGFLIAMLYMLAARHFGNIEAAAGFAFGFLIIGLICYLVNMGAARKARRQRQRERGPELRSLAMAAGISFLPALVRSRLALPALALPVLGLIALRIVHENRRPPEDGEG